MADEKNATNIKKLKVVCRNCKTEIILTLPVGMGITHCPRCKESLNIDPYNDVFVKLSDALTTMSDNKKVDFIFVCEEQ